MHRLFSTPVIAAETIKQFPHCDAKVLHAPGECQYCDKHPDWQSLRVIWDMNFTGHHDPKKTLCPAERARGIDILELWGGNRATNGTAGDRTPETTKTLESDLR